MNELNPRLLQELKGMDAELDESKLFYLFASNLDVTAPHKRVRTLCAFFTSELRVYSDGVLTRMTPMDEIREFSVVAGVGCVFASYTTHSGDSVVFARGDARFEATVGQALKRANHFLRYGDLDFSRFSDAAGKSCPKCGKPYPRGSRTCPSCSSKKQALRRLIALAKSEWRFIAASMSLFLVTTAVGVLTPYINRVMVDDYIQNTPSADGGRTFWIGFACVVLSLLAANLIKRLVSIGRGYFLTVAGNNLIVRLRDMVFCKIQSLSIAKISSRTAGELMTRVNSDTSTIKQFLITHMPSVLEQALLLIAVSGALFWYDWKLALLILLPMPFVSYSFRMFWRFVRTMMHRRRELNARGSATLHDIFAGIRVVKAYGMEKREEERFVAMAAKEREVQMRLETFWAFILPTLQFLMGLGEYVLLYYVGRQMLGGTMTAGEMSQFSAYAGMIYGPLNALMIFPRHFSNMMTSVTRIFEIMDETVDITDGQTDALTSLAGHIKLDHVSFGYEDAKEVLRDINLDIQPGEFVGLVGKSGVGKSTLINLIMRMYDVDEGAILIDGVDIRDIPQEVLRSQMGVVLQESFLFTGTVWQNLTYAKPNATREEVIQAAKSAGAHEFIIRLPDGYNTYVGEKGHTLSGGERQRISIARALLHNPKILILDEATASLDTETEKLIQDALQALSSGRTTIAIAHRLSTLRNATRLVVFDRGQIAEVGTHDELMERQGIYYGLVMAQREMTNMK